MFEIIKCNDNICIRYSDLHKKRFLIRALAFCCLSLFGSIFMLFLYLFEGISIVISLICAASFFCSVIVFFIRYGDIYKFIFTIDASGIKFFTKKEKYEAGWEEIKSYGIINRAGSESIDDTLAGTFYNRPSATWMYNKSTLYFSKLENPNFKKIIYHIRTNFLIDHGIFMGVCCISENREKEPFFYIVKEAVARFCSNEKLKLSIWDATHIV